MNQLDLIAESAKVRNDAKETSRLAALKILPRTGTIRRRVLNEVYLAGYWGRTDDEIVDILHVSPNTVRPRRVELVEGGWVVDSGQCRKNRFGNQCIVWIVTPDAIEALLS